MKYRNLGSTKIEVSVIGFGTWALAGDFTWGPQDEKTADAVVRLAVDLGINFFDTAEIYGEGRSEEILGNALAGIRDQVVIATKARSSHLAPKALRDACEGSLRRLRTDRIDLYQLHWPRRDGPISETIETLEKLHAEGKILAYGLSNFGIKDMAEVFDAGGRPTTNQLAYSLLFRAIEYEILPACEKAKLSVIPYSPLMEGLLTGKFPNADAVPPERARTRHFAATRKHTRHGEPGLESETFQTLAAINQMAHNAGVPMAQLALAWLAARDQIATVIAGARSPEQVRINAGAGDLILDSEILAELNRVTEDLKQKLGPNPDMWQSESRIK